MVFLKFYSYYYTSRHAQILNRPDVKSLSDESLAEMIFAENEHLVDMKDLAKYLISRVGN